eukprot:576993-Pleurochrysis_carterae.AAC.1
MTRELSETTVLSRWPDKYRNTNIPEYPDNRSGRIRMDNCQRPLPIDSVTDRNHRVGAPQPPRPRLLPRRDYVYRM